MTGPEQLARLVRTALAAAGLPDRDPAIERPRQRTHGDWATNVALTLAKPLGRPPRDIAQDVLEHLELPDDVAGAEVAGPGFLNFRLSHGALEQIVRAAVTRAAEWGATSETRGRLNVEFVSANPTGPLHIGAGRWAAVGDALARLLDATGWEVTREYYLNDAGSQMDKFGESVAAAMRGEEPPEDGYRGSYVTELADALRSEGVPADDLVAVREAAYERMLARIQTTFATFGVTYDVWYSERELHESGAVRDAAEQLRASGHAYVHDGALWLRTTDFGDDKDRVLVRANGEPTYFAADCAYMAAKFDRGFDVCVYLLGAGHSGYVARLQAIAAAQDREPGQVEILIGQNVNLLRAGETVTMSKRTGDLVTFDELIGEVGVDAARYTLLRSSTDQTLDFDLAEVVRQHRENPVYYVQYSHARIAGIMRSATERGVVPGTIDEAALDLLTHDAEEELIRRIGAYPEMVAYAAEQRAPHRIAHYAEDLAEGFHKFYTECQVLGDDEQLTRARYWLCVAARQTLVNALGLLGVGAPDQM